MSETNEQTITITKAEYNSLVKDSLLLGFLEENGVDNWEGYDEAMSEYHKVLKHGGDR